MKCLLGKLRLVFPFRCALSMDLKANVFQFLKYSRVPVLLSVEIVFWSHSLSLSTLWKQNCFEDTDGRKHNTRGKTQLI